MLTHFESQEQIDSFSELLKTDIETLTFATAQALVKDIHSMLPADKQVVFAAEWSKHAAAAIAVSPTSITANSTADVAMIAYAQRFF